MMMLAAALDCCANPDLQQLRELIDENHCMVDIYKCSACGQHWLGQWYEEMNFDGGDDYTDDFYTKLTPQEAERLSAGKNPERCLLAATTTIHFTQGNPQTKRVLPIQR